MGQDPLEEVRVLFINEFGYELFALSKSAVETVYASFLVYE